VKPKIMFKTSSLPERRDYCIHIRSKVVLIRIIGSAQWCTTRIRPSETNGRKIQT